MMLTLSIRKKITSFNIYNKMDEDLCLIQILVNEGCITEEEQAILIQLYLNGELNAPKYNNFNYK